MMLASKPTAALVPPDFAWLGGGYSEAYDVALARVAVMVMLLIGVGTVSTIVETLAVNALRIAEMRSGLEVGGAAAAISWESKLATMDSAVTWAAGTGARVGVVKI